MVTKIIILIILTALALFFLRLQKVIYIPITAFKWFILFAIAMGLLAFFSASFQIF